MIGLIISFVASYALSVLTAPKPQNARPSSLSQANIPTASADGAIPVLFGTRLITQPNVVWYGHMRTEKIKVNAGRKFGLFGPHKKQTIGYRYYLGFHMVLAARVDAITQIQVNKKTVWHGDVSANQQIYIDAPRRFGGDKSEGGIQGRVDVELGADDQPRNSYLAHHLPGRVPAYRGVSALVLRQVYIGTSLYLKPWAVRARRIPSWYPDKGNINGDCNPAHILYELITDADIGMGYTEQDIDITSFQAAADTLYDEGFGLSLLWTQQMDIENFQKEILKHIDGSLFVDIKTGLFTLELARADYDIDAIPSLDASNVLTISNFSRPALGELTSQVSVVYEEADTGESKTVTATDIALMTAQGAVVATTIQYPGVSTADRATKLAWRDLAQLSTPLAKLTITTNRHAANLRTGDVFKLTWPAYGIQQLAMRVADINYGTLTDGKITLQAAEDVFGLEDALYATPTPTAWEDPSQPPAPAPVRQLVEATYRQIINEIAGADQWATIDPNSGFVTVLATKPSGDALDYTLADRRGTSAFSLQDDQEFTPNATLNADIGPTDTLISFATTADLDAVAGSAFQLAYLEDELVGVLNLQPGSANLQRGLLDTVPTTHAMGARLWVMSDDRLGIDADNVWANGQEIDVRLLPTTTQGQLALADAPTDSITIAHRAVRPFPPGNVRVNGSAYPDYITGALSTNWAHRDRTQQLTVYTQQNDGDQGPEAGTTYTVVIHGDNDVLLRSEVALSGTHYAYSLADELADTGRTYPNETLTVEISSQRNGYQAWQTQHVTIAECRGFGMFFGAYFGQ